MRAMSSVDEDWKVDAACRGAEPEQFHVVGAGTETWSQAQRVIEAFCWPCPVWRQCREYADATRSSGVWGGELRRADGERQGRPGSLPRGLREAS